MKLSMFCIGVFLKTVSCEGGNNMCCLLTILASVCLALERVGTHVLYRIPSGYQCHQQYEDVYA